MRSQFVAGLLAMAAMAAAFPCLAGKLVENGGLRPSLEESVAKAQVIVVGTALDFAPAPPRQPGDLTEYSIRFRVTRVLKGKLADEVITTRTPTFGGEFIGKDWIVLLSPEYVAGKYPYASHCSIELEPTV